MTVQERLAAALACPECHKALDATLVCPGCGHAGQRQGQRLHFGGFGDDELRSDWLNRAKETAKQRLGRLYPLAIDALAPVLTRNFVRPFLRGFDLDTDLVVDLGSGTNRYDPRVACVDGGSYANVDLVCDLRTLPLADASVDGIVSVAVLEHVPDPQAHVAEMRRVLAPGGRVVCFVPFMQPFHASPHDYQRFTDVGLKNLFQDFEVLSVRPGAGPTSSLLWVLQEWLALAGSLGSRRLYRLLVPLMWLLSPLKLLDLVLARHPEAHVVASAFVVEARRPVAEDPAAADLVVGQRRHHDHDRLGQQDVQMSDLDQ
jgi:SAM-dependent methyltransferase